MSSSLSFFLCLLATYLIAVQAGGLKILGGFVKEYSETSSSYYGISFRWGQSSADGNSREMFIENMYCWSILRTKRAYCAHYLVVSNKDDPNEEHYQIIGSYQRAYKNDYVLETKCENGITEARPPYEKLHVANGETWVQATNSYRYAELFFFVNKTTQPSITDDMSYSAMNSKDHAQQQEEVFRDYHEGTSARIQFHAVRRWSESWGKNTYLYVYFWRAPTVLVNMIPLEDQATFVSLDIRDKQTVVLSNEGSGMTSPDLPILGTTQTFTTTSQSRFLNTFDFSYSFEEAVSVSIFAVRSETTMSESFTWHNEAEMTQTNSVTSSEKIKWPNECPAGFKITYSVIEYTEVQELPIELHFRRAGVEWTEIDMLRVTLRKVELTKDDCCIYDWADESCGSESLDMC